MAQPAGQSIAANSYEQLFNSPLTTRTLILGKSGSGKTMSAINQIIPALVNKIISFDYDDQLERVPIILFSTLKADSANIKNTYSMHENTIGKAVILPRADDGIIGGSDVQQIINIICKQHPIYDLLNANIDPNSQVLFFINVFDDGGAVHKTAVPLLRSLFNGVDRHNSSTCVYIQQTSIFSSLKSSFLTNINYIVFTSPINLTLFKDLAQETSLSIVTKSVSNANSVLTGFKKNIIYDTQTSIFYSADRL